MGHSVAATLLYNTPDLAACMREQLPSVVLVENGTDPDQVSVDGSVIGFAERLPFPAAWNRAVPDLRVFDHLTMTYVWMLNSDLCWLSETMQHALEVYLDLHPDVMAVTPAFNSPHAIFRGGGSTRPVPWMDWCLPMVRLDAWDALGGFDAAFSGYGADIDLCYRARQQGWKFAVLGEFEANHLGSLTAIRHAMVGVQNDYVGMERILRQKWGKSWQELTGF